MIISMEIFRILCDLILGANNSDLNFKCQTQKRQRSCEDAGRG